MVEEGEGSNEDCGKEGIGGGSVCGEGHVLEA